MFPVFGFIVLCMTILLAFSQSTFSQVRNNMKQENSKRVEKDKILPTPSNLTARRVSSSRIDLTWKLTGKSKSGLVILERSLNENDFSDAEIFELKANTESFTDTKNLTPAKEHYYRVKVVNNKDNSLYSDVSSVLLTQVNYFGDKEPPVSQ